METPSQTEQLTLLKDKIKNVRVAMLTTVAEDGGLRSRPMQTNEMDDDGTLWFFTKESSGKMDEISQEHQVCLAYADPEANTYVSVKGTAVQVDSEARKRELYTPALKAWFPEGLNDPQLTLLKVTIDEAEYWDGSSSKLVVGFKMLKAVLTGEPYRDGDHGKVTL